MNSRLNGSGITASSASASEPFRPPIWLRSGHLQTIWPTLFRTVSLAPPQADVLATADGDELHLDWYCRGNPRLAILSHGLEGHSRRPYMLGMARALLEAGWDVLAWNFRSCGGVMNHLPRFYHSGTTEDLDAVVQYALSSSNAYQKIVLSGFSMGGNLTLLYLAQQGENLDSRISSSVTFSVPCDLAGSAEMLARPCCRIYMRRFLDDLHTKMSDKARLFPDQISVDGFENIRNFREFDDRYTAPLHGFQDAADYWACCSCEPYLNQITVPSLIVNAADDPFLSPSCYPEKQRVRGKQVFLEKPRHGGHVGFVNSSATRHYWSERRAVAFLESVTVSSV